MLLYSDLHLRRAAIELGPEAEVGWSPPYLLDWVRRWPEEKPAVISLSGNPTPDLLADLDPALVAVGPIRRTCARRCSRTSQTGT